MKKNHNIISKKTLYSGFFKLHEFTLKHKKHDSSWSRPLTREIFSGAHVATVLPYDKKEKKIILIDQFRTGLIEKSQDPIIKEIVGGIIDKNESPEETAMVGDRLLTDIVGANRAGMLSIKVKPVDFYSDPKVLWLARGV